MLHSIEELKHNIKRDKARLKKTKKPMKRNRLKTAIECWEIGLDFYGK